MHFSRGACVKPRDQALHHSFFARTISSDNIASERAGLHDQLDVAGKFGCGFASVSDKGKRALASLPQPQILKANFNKPHLVVIVNVFVHHNDPQHVAQRIVHVNVERRVENRSRVAFHRHGAHALSANLKNNVGIAFVEPRRFQQLSASHYCDFDTVRARLRAVLLHKRGEVLRPSPLHRVSGAYGRSRQALTQHLVRKRGVLLVIVIQHASQPATVRALKLSAVIVAASRQPKALSTKRHGQISNNLSRLVCQRIHSSARNTRRKSLH